jgi:hypothetical protein
MKQLFLTGIATLFLTAGTAHATVQLPETMLGDWCFNEAKEAYYIMDPKRRTPLRHPRGPHQPRWELVSSVRRQGHFQTQAGNLFDPSVAANVTVR